MAVEIQLLMELRRDVAEIREDVRNIYRILNGNGRDGLMVKIDRNTGFRRNAARVLWMLFGTVTGLAASIVVILVKLFVTR